MNTNNGYNHGPWIILDDKMVVSIGKERRRLEALNAAVQALHRYPNDLDSQITWAKRFEKYLETGE